MGHELKEPELDWLDAKLREEMPYIDDAGFTAQVVQQLPSRRRAPRYARSAILLAAAVIASIVAFVVAGSTVVESAAFLAAVPLPTLAIFALALTMLLMIAGGAVALLRSRDVRL